MKRILIFSTILFLGLAKSYALTKPNVLLLLVDDLKPAMGCYGDEHAITPHMDSLAKRGVRFDLAYCNQAVCAPSRFTLMLGAHSTSTGLYGLGSHLRRVIPNAVTMSQYFSRYGYRAESLGKVFHIGHGNLGDPQAFEVPHFHDKVIEYLVPESTDGGKLTREEALFTNQKLGQIRSLPRGAAIEAPDAKDEDYADGRVANETIVRLKAARRVVRRMAHRFSSQPVLFGHTCHFLRRKNIGTCTIRPSCHWRLTSRFPRTRLGLPSSVVEKLPPSSRCHRADLSMMIWLAS